MGEFWGPLTTGLTVLTALTAFGYYFDNKITEEYRNLFLNVLDVVFPVDEDKIQNKNNWPALLIHVFDYIFHTKTKSEQPAFWRSVCASSFIFSLIAIYWVLYSPARALALYSKEILSRGSEQIVLLSIAVFVFAAFVNGIGDFFSLWASRMFIGRMAVFQKTWSRVVVLFLDAIVSILIFSIGITAGLAFSEIIGVGHMPTFAAKFDDTFGGFFLELGFLFVHSRSEYDIVGILFYTTLMTSIWVWVFLFGLGLWRGLKILRNILDVHKHPLGSIMTLGAIPLAFIITGVGYFI